MKFYRCAHCGKIITVLKESGVPVICCGENMQEIIPGTKDASLEKHVPVYSVERDKVVVSVGEVEHPMIPEHYIEWVAIETNKGNQIKYLNPGEKPECVFMLTDGELIESVYAYCNLHDLWKA